jgi:hypothetical protein
MYTEAHISIPTPVLAPIPPRPLTPLSAPAVPKPEQGDGEAEEPHGGVWGPESMYILLSLISNLQIGRVYSRKEALLLYCCSTTANIRLF